MVISTFQSLETHLEPDSGVLSVLCSPGYASYNRGLSETRTMLLSPLWFHVRRPVTGALNPFTAPVLRKYILFGAQEPPGAPVGHASSLRHLTFVEHTFSEKSHPDTGLELIQVTNDGSKAMERTRTALLFILSGADKGFTSQIKHAECKQVLLEKDNKFRDYE